MHICQDDNSVENRMDRRKFLRLCTTLAALAAVPCSALAADSGRIVLPAPDKSGGKPLMQTLALRRSTRSFSNSPLSQQILGDLLWAAWGVNRSDGRRTAPTGRNRQEVAVYAVLENGVWRYDAAEHALVRELAGDFRAGFGGAPLVLLYAAPQGPWTGMHVGSMYQNVGLYCASAGLGNVVRASGVSVLQGKVPLPDGWRIVMTQSVGWPV